MQKGQSSEEELETDELDDRQDVRTSTLRTPVCELSGHSGAISTADWLSGRLKRWNKYGYLIGCLIKFILFTQGAEQVITAGWDRLAVLHDVETGNILTTLTGINPLHR